MPVHEAFERERDHLTRLAYRMLGVVADAEDTVQDAYVRWLHAGEPELDAPRAWFTRTVTRLCVDRLRRDARGPAYPGEWLPEPWIDPRAEQERLDETLSVALLATIRRLAPRARAVFLLHDVFGYAFDEVAAMLDLKVDHCRQIASRARRDLRERPVTAPRDPAGERRIGEAFFSAIRDGELDRLRDLLCDDVVMRSDGGGKVVAVPYPLHGKDRVVRFFDKIYRGIPELQQLRIAACWANGEPAFAMLTEDGIESWFTFVCVDGRIAEVLVQRNPDKLARPADALFGRGRRDGLS
ncbi:MAG: RNA polymerase sigma factor SigJ [Planctomycetota bacterium]